MHFYRYWVRPKDDALGSGGRHEGRGVGRRHPDEALLHGHLGVPLTDAEMVGALGGDPAHSVLLRLLDGQPHDEVKVVLLGLAP